MSEAFPISCISCRRKKIKCNKLKPCNQCKKRSIVCEFPSTFRNIKINEGEFDAMEFSQSTEEEKFGDEVHQLRRERVQLLQDNMKLAHKNHKLTGVLRKANVEKSSNIPKKRSIGSEGEDAEKRIPINGETGELGEKYYGPQSSNYMMEQLRYNSGLDFLGSYKKQKIQEGLMETGSDTKSSNNSFDSSLIEQSLQKKRLPYLLDINSDGSDINDLDQKTNITILRSLVDLFFQVDPYFRVFVSKSAVVNFLNSYEELKDKEWENDDDMLLLDMILILTLHKITPRQYVNLLHPDESKYSYNRHKTYMTRHILFHQFEKLRHNLINESIITVQSYILCTEWYFIQQRYEECWSMLFHTCSIAYAIGLHVTGRFKSDTESLDGNDVARYKCWFALKNVSCQICSILGRPSPISVQVNQVVLKSSNETISSDVDLKKTVALLKIGVSECLRSSNLMLIENFMLDFDFEDLIVLEKSFAKEISLLEWFFSTEDFDTRDVTTPLVYGDDYERPVNIDKNNVLSDLIILYVNRAKLFEPFVNKFAKLESEHHEVLTIITASILKYLTLIDQFLQSFVNTFAGEYFDDSNNDLRLGKIFRTRHPFLSFSIHQGIVVIFALLHYELKPQSASSLSQSFLDELQEKLSRLGLVDRTFSRNYKKPTSFWSSNTTYLLDSIVTAISLIRDKHEKGIHSGAGDKDVINTNESLEVNNFHIDFNDPFWLTNPENLPFYLSSSSDDSVGSKQISPIERRSLDETTSGVDHPIQPEQNPSSGLFGLNDIPNQLYGNVWSTRDVNAAMNTAPGAEQSPPGHQVLPDPYMFSTTPAELPYQQPSVQSVSSSFLSQDFQSTSDSREGSIHQPRHSRSSGSRGDSSKRKKS